MYQVDNTDYTQLEWGEVSEKIPQIVISISL